ncbi:MAG: T9SS type A sorting domain-containing protein [Prevotella sp.]|nr:T9SS type A sorting domain-containing protein [Prevotella sp.]MCR5151868.1 T9SS type A sorting domain-containing protein [Prevotella sp.]
MKRIILSVVSCLLLGVATAMASNELVIHLTSGITQRFVLLNEEPVITFSGSDVIIKTSNTEVTYSMKEIEYFNYEDRIDTAISGVETDGVNNGMSLNGDMIVFSGLPAGSKIYIYGAGGQLMTTETVGDDGCANVSLSDFQRGIYLVKAANISTKITKK